MLKASMAAIMRKMRGGGLAELLVKAGAFNGEAAATSALNGSHVNNGMWAHSLLYQCFQSTNLRLWLEEEEDAGDLDAVELSTLKAAVADFEAGGPDATDAMAPGGPMARCLARFRAHQEKLAARSGQAKLHLQYLRDVEDILLHKRLIRQPGPRDFKVYLSSLEQLHILSCSGDRINYARLIACQLRAWETMPVLFPELYGLVQKGLCSALVSTNEKARVGGPAGGGVSHDLMIEKIMARIKDAKAGVNAFAGSTDRLTAWFGARRYLAELSDRAGAFAPKANRDMTKGKADEIFNRRARTKKDAAVINEVNKLMGMGFNPFDEVSNELFEDMSTDARLAEQDKVYHLTSHSELAPSAAKQLLQAQSLGAERSRLMLNRLRKDSGELIWDHQATVGIEGFVGKQTKRTKTKARDEVISVLYWHLFSTADAGTGVGGVSPAQLLEHTLADGGCPALFVEGDSTDQAMRKTTKSDWSSVDLGGPVAKPAFDAARTGMSTDFMAFARAVGPAWKRKDNVTFGSISEKIATAIVSRAAKTCGYLTVVVDVYGKPGSRLLKDSATNRGESRVKVQGAKYDHTVASKASWFDYLRSDVHKNEWSAMLPRAFQRVLQRRKNAEQVCPEVYLTCGGEGQKICARWCVSAPRYNTVVNEADSNVVANALTLAKCNPQITSVVINAADADVLCGGLAFGAKMAPERLTVFALRPKAGKKEERWYNLSERRNSLKEKHGTLFVEALFGAYVSTGCDIVSAVFSVGKKKVSSALTKLALDAKSSTDPGVKANAVTALKTLAAIGSSQAEDGQVILDKARARGAGPGVAMKTLKAEVVKGAEIWLAYLYGKPEHTTAASLRLNAAKKRNGNGQKKRLPPEKIPPSTQEWAMHFLRAHYAAMLWVTALQNVPPDTEPSPQGYGWVGLDNDWKPVFSTMPPFPEELTDAAHNAPATGDDASGAEDEDEDENESGGDGEEADDGDRDGMGGCQEDDHAFDDEAEGGPAVNHHPPTGSNAAKDDAHNDEAARAGDELEEEEADHLYGWSADLPQGCLSSPPAGFPIGCKDAMVVYRNDDFNMYAPQQASDGYWLARLVNYWAAGPKIQFKHVSDDGISTYQKLDVERLMPPTGYGPKPAGEASWAIVSLPSTDAPPASRSNRYRDPSASGANGGGGSSSGQAALSSGDQTGGGGGGGGGSRGQAALPNGANNSGGGGGGGQAAGRKGRPKRSKGAMGAVGAAVVAAAVVAAASDSTTAVPNRASQRRRTLPIPPPQTRKSKNTEPAGVRKKRKAIPQPPKATPVRTGRVRPLRKGQRKGVGS